MKARGILFLSILSIGIFTHKPILVKWITRAVQTQLDCIVDYKSASWEQGGFVLSQVVLCDADFNAYLEKVALTFDWRSWKLKIAIDRPFISCTKLPQIKPSPNKTFPFALTTNQGKLKWGDLADFTLDLNGEEGQFLCEKGESKIGITFSPDQKKIHCDNWDPHFLLPNEFQDCKLTGDIELNSQNESLSFALSLSGMANTFPFLCTGKSEKPNCFDVHLQFDKAYCHFIKNEDIAIDCNLQTEHIALLQSILPFFSLGSFSLPPCHHLEGHFSLNHIDGFVQGPNYELKWLGAWDNWKAIGSLFGGPFVVQGHMENEQCTFIIEQSRHKSLTVSGLGAIDFAGNGHVELIGECLIGSKTIPFKAPLKIANNQCQFDFRLLGETWDYMRLQGVYDGTLSFAEKSHFLGNPLHITSDHCHLSLSQDALHLLGIEQTQNIDLNIAMGEQIIAHAQMGEQNFCHAILRGAWPEFAIEKIELNWSECDKKNEFHFEGKGLLQLENLNIDLLGTISNLKLQSQSFQTPNPLHVTYDHNGLGLYDLNISGKYFNGTIGSILYRNEHWLLQQIQGEVPPLNAQFQGQLQYDDLTSIHGTFETLKIPFFNETHTLENVFFSWEKNMFDSEFSHLGHRHKLSGQRGDPIIGALVLGSESDPLTIRWQWDHSLQIESISGQFSGINAQLTLHNPHILIGTIHCDFAKLSPLLPDALAQAFHELKMGKGYELKGIWDFTNNFPSFQGSLLGTHVDFFGFEWNSLYGDIYLNETEVRLSDIHLADMGGFLKIDEILLQEQPDAWTIHMPFLQVTDLRPSLLKKVGQEKGDLDPLVVRKGTLHDFQGKCDDGKTFTAHGDLHFINSFKRGKTILDAPINLLSRIIGLDLDLLIPVKGDLTFELKDGYFNLLELNNAFSENKRSQFFLETDPPATMDLDGQLQIMVRMKQFVLFKLTEAFHIAIDGKLDDPQFHLQKRKWGF